jgi:hypothetical protein
MIDMKDFGKDHWSLFAYIETLCVDGKDGLGVIDKRRVRCNENTHPLLKTNNGFWQDNYGTRLKGYFTDNGKDESQLLKEHDDWDCLEDIDNAGLVEFITLTSGGVTMTEKGFKVADELRKHKANGGVFARFEYIEEGN